MIICKKVQVYPYFFTAVSNFYFEYQSHDPKRVSDLPHRKDLKLAKKQNKNLDKLFKVIKNLYDKLIIHLRLLKITSDTTSLNISSVVSNVYTPTMPHLNTYAASKHSGIPMHHVPTISITKIGRAHV